MSESHPDGSITTETRGRIFLIGLNRPEKLNGITPKMFDELTTAYRQLDNDNELRVGVLFAHGKHFTAGLDLPKFVEGMKVGRSSAGSGDGVDVYGLKHRCRKPIVCAVQGITYTAGLEMMLACDIAIAASDCRFSQLEPKRGIMAAGGATVRFVERAGYGNAMYHLLRCDEFNVDEAYRMGFVQEIVEPGTQVDRAIAIAEEIEKLAPLAIQETKASSMRSLAEGQEAAIAAFDATRKRLSNTEDAAEGVASFKEKREAVFKGK